MIKLKANPKSEEDSKKIQEYWFKEYDARWAGGAQIKHLDKPYLYLEGDLISWCDYKFRYECGMETYTVFQIAKNKELMKNTIKRQQLLDAYNQFNCEEWKSSIDAIIRYNFAGKTDKVGIPQHHIEKLIKEGTPDMIKYVQDLGIDVKVDKNAFIKGVPSSATLKVSEECFGVRNAFQIASFSTLEINRPDLQNKSFYLAPGYKLITHDIPERGTVIEIQKK